MATNQQRRDAARRKLQRQNERRARQQSSLRQRLTIVGVIVGVLAVVGVVWMVSSMGSETEPTEAGNVAAGSASEAYGDGSASGSADGTADDGPATGENGTSAGACDYPPDGTAARPVTAPTNLSPTNSGTTTATIALDTGDVTVALDRAATPCTVNSFVSLAEQHYFDDTQCHRLTSSPSLSVLQCGDPTATGTGGPGYTFPDELSGSETYGAGTLAMANRGPDTNGSQFFLVYADSQLPPNYAVFGHVTEGLDVVQAIAAKGTTNGGQDGSPVDPVTIESVSVAP